MPSFKRKFTCLTFAVFGIVCVVEFTLLPPAQAQQPADDGHLNPWWQFPDGSWIIVSVGSKRDGITRERPREKLLRNGLDGPDGRKRIIVQRHREENGQFPDKPVSSPDYVGSGVDPFNSNQFKLIATRSEKSMLEGVNVDCEVKEYDRLENPGKKELRFTLWHCKDVKLPFRRLEGDPDVTLGPNVVRYDISVKGPNETGSVSMRVVSTKEMQRVGNRDLKCMREDGEAAFENNSSRKDAVKYSRWISSEVPGYIVRTSMVGEGNGRKVEQIWQVAEFHVPKSK